MSDRNNQIDFVIAWVDGSDKKWQEEKALYTGCKMSAGHEAEDDREERYRDGGTLKYWFRGVEKYAPWVRKIFFVTWGHLPEWLDTSNEKLVIVNHKDYIPEQFLPTFNSHTIEWNFHRIPGLSEQFVYFNDDMLLVRPVESETFFQNGKPRDMMAFQPVVANVDSPVMPYIYLNNSMLLAKYFDKRVCVKKNWKQYFHIGYPMMYFFYNMLELAFPRYTGFYTVHGPSPLLKSTYRTLWEKEQECLTETCSHKVRSKEDVSQYVLREWQKLSGEFVPGDVQRDCRYFNMDHDNRALIHTIRNQMAKMVCVNDSNEQIDFERVTREIGEAFESILPEKSSFER